MPGHLWEYLLYHLGFSPSSPEGIQAALAYLLPSLPSFIVLTSVETLSENTCSRFTSVLLVLKMAQKRLWPDGDNGTPAKGKKKPPTVSAKKTPPLTMSLYSRSNEPNDTVPLVEMQLF